MAYVKCRCGGALPLVTGYDTSVFRGCSWPGPIHAQILSLLLPILASTGPLRVGEHQSVAKSIVENKLGQERGAGTSLKAPAGFPLAHCLAVGHKHLPRPSPGASCIRARGERYGWEDSGGIAGPLFWQT